MKMFCYQCQETAKGKGCEIQGVCGKKPETSTRMDQLLYIVRGMAIVNGKLREKGAADRNASHFIIDALFTTITNANFDNPMLDDFISKGLELKNELIGTAKKRGVELPYMPEVSYHITKESYGKLEVVDAGSTLDEEIFSVLHEKNEDIRGLK